MKAIVAYLGIAALCAALVHCTPAAAQSPYHAPEGIALEGYDPVAYFTQGRAVRGKPAHELRWDGVLWRFASAQHLESFSEAPERYAPQYGGYCALGVAVGKYRRGDPRVFAVVDDKLYINFSSRIHARWEQRQQGFIRRADQQWAGAP